MEEKIEVGDYVRTNNKGIKRIDRIDNNKTVNKYLYFTGIEDFEGKEYGIIKTTEIVKHRKQLIDLIDVGDILKIKISEEWVEKQDTIKFVVVGQTYTITEIKRCLENGLFKIIQILTHEQFEANCYKVGGE